MKKLMLLSALLCITLLPHNVVIAEESEQKIPDELLDSIAAEIEAELNLSYLTSSVYDDYVIKSVDSNQLPESFDLRDKGVVTSVKLQYPFGTCWAFGAIAASETSILTKLGMTCEEFAQKYGFDMDLSERQVAFFVHNAIPEAESAGYNDQGGEGSLFINEYKNKEMTGGMANQAGDIFSDGTGPAFESKIPYRGKDGITAMETTSRGSLVQCYSEEDDWAVSEEYRQTRDFDLIDCSELICPAYLDENGNYYYNPYGTYDIKCALYEGYGVEIAFRADNSMPGKPSESAYINTVGEDPAWAHYTYDVLPANHAVCIVGWDDDYPASNFTEGHQPPANGAWIVKNSWGSVNSDEMNTCDWGYQGSGYFYLSYYDKSLENPTVFDFDLSKFLGEEEGTELKEYDYTVTNVTSCVEFNEDVASANIFTVDEDSILQSIAVCTRDYNSSIVYMIYKLNDDSSGSETGTLLTAHSVQLEHAGTHRITLDSPISFSKGDRIAIVVKNVRTGEDGSLIYTLRVNSVINETGALLIADPTNAASYDTTMYQNAVVNAGESCVLFRGSWYDWKDIVDALKTKGGDCKYVDIDNFTIKAYFTA